MEPLYAKAAWILASVVMGVVRAPHVRRSGTVKVAHSHYGALDVALVVLVGIGMVLLPVLWLATSLLRFADVVLCPIALAAGLTAYGAGLWLLYRSHADLGTNWSNTLQVREGHRLVTGGVYRRIRHPMYSALLLHALGQALVVPNLVAGPGFLVAFALLVASRLGPEERMLRGEFGPEYVAYAARTRRLVPGVW